jgi:hypothetical protein
MNPWFVTGLVEAEGSFYVSKIIGDLTGLTLHLE